MAAKCWPYLKSLNAHNFLIFQPILVILVSNFVVHRTLSDKAYLSLGLLSPFIVVVALALCILMDSSFWFDTINLG